MKTYELRLDGSNYVIITNGTKSSTTFPSMMRMMAVNKFKFLCKNTPTPFNIQVDDAQGNEIMNEEITALGRIDDIK